MTRTYQIEVDCANCANRMETAARGVPGVRSVQVNFMTLTMTVEFAPEADIPAVMAAVRKRCKRVESDCEVLL